MKLPNQQRGMTGISWLFTFALILMLVLGVIKLVPVYLEQFNVSSVLDSLATEPGIGDMSGGEVTTAIMKGLNINMVKSVTPDDIYISQRMNTRIIEIEYQVQRKLVGNIDVLISFNNRIEVPIH